MTLFFSSKRYLFRPYGYVTFLCYILGFLCPVHTPDGSPCGLLNHMAASCQVIDNRNSDGWRDIHNLVIIITGLGLMLILEFLPNVQIVFLQISVRLSRA